MMTVSCFRQLSWCAQTLVAGVVLFLSSVGPLGAQAIVIPTFFDRNERFEKPDLSNLSRLRFLTTVDFPPFNYFDRSHNLAGYNIDLARALCMELKVENICQIEALPWPELAARLSHGKGEAVIAGLAPTADNRLELAFSRPYMRFPARFISLQGVTPAQPFALWLRSQRIGVIRDTAHENMLAAYFPNSNRVAFADSASLYQALGDKTISLAFGDGLAFSQWLNDPQNEQCCRFIAGAYPGPGYLGQGMRIAVSRKNARLALAMDHALQALERKGKLAELYLRYFPLGLY